MHINRNSKGPSTVRHGAMHGHIRVKEYRRYKKFIRNGNELVGVGLTQRGHICLDKNGNPRSKIYDRRGKR